MEKDTELLDFINSLDENLSYKEKCNKVIEWRRENRGVKGCHLTVDPTKFDNDTDGVEEVCRSWFKMIKAEAEGKYSEDNSPCI